MCVIGCTVSINGDGEENASWQSIVIKKQRQPVTASECRCYDNGKTTFFIETWHIFAKTYHYRRGTLADRRACFCRMLSTAFGSRAATLDSISREEKYRQRKWLSGWKIPFVFFPAIMAARQLSNSGQPEHGHLMNIACIICIFIISICAQTLIFCFVVLMFQRHRCAEHLSRQCRLCEARRLRSVEIHRAWGILQR